MIQEDDHAHLEPEDTPLDFYDRHISSTLLCKRVASFPSMASVLSKTCDEAFSKFYKEGRHLSPTGRSRIHNVALMSSIAFDKSHSIGEYYELYVGIPINAYAIKFYINPYSTSWDSAFLFDQQYEDYNASNFVSEWKLQLYHGSPRVFEPTVAGMPESKIQQYEDLLEQYPFIALWHFYPRTASGKSLLKNMLPQQSFLWECARTAGYKNKSLTPPPPDASSGVLHHRRNPYGERINANGGQLRKQSATYNFREEGPVGSEFTRKRSSVVSVHRQSESTRATRKRVDAQWQFIQYIGYDEVKDEISKRELALMTLNYGIYCSPVPATFLRLSSPGISRDFHPTSKSKFRPTGYIDMTLSQPMGKGAVGVVHPATVSIELELESGDVVEHKLVVKLAFSRTQKAGLKHEYDVYSHFAKAGYVGNIVDVHGLFEDPDSNTLALVMENGGRSLAHLNDEEEDGVDQVTGATIGKQWTLTACLNALKSIHAAGVHHGDIRPHNVLFDDKGRVKIIDFDSSTFDPDQINERMFENELSRLEAVLDGSYVDGGWFS
ncbi:hypothetical protein D9613_001544 [Agrocybe pediades]|uniref:Protein kinase domain-containing protein n=1 Tax=Agrocybe pediades TaxID=84607 RepID=A0A8H4R686_9AGAR|nr:hypothetical protein D9613_001544 [Agrocybe pediades]